MDSVQQEQQFPNAISFNGNINSGLFDVGDGFVAFEFIGPNNEEFPLILIKGDFKDVSNLLTKGDKLVGVGILLKMQGQWVIKAEQINRIPPEKEVEIREKIEKENSYASKKVAERKQKILNDVLENQKITR